jgi:hypothetical protein
MPGNASGIVPGFGSAYESMSDHDHYMAQLPDWARRMLREDVAVPMVIGSVVTLFRKYPYLKSGDLRWLIELYNGKAALEAYGPDHPATAALPVKELFTL